MFNIQANNLRTTFLASLVALTMALLSPAVLAGQHGRFGGHHGGYAHGSYGRHAYTHRSRAYRYRGHRSYRGSYAYSRPVRYRHYRRHDHWRAGEVLGAVVAGAIITNVIADAFQPRTTVVERRVYDGNYREYSPGTRYMGRDSGYYDERR